MKSVAVFIVVVVLALAIWVLTRAPPSLEQELATLAADERQALDALSQVGGVPVSQLRAVAPGVLQYNPRAVAIQDGHVVELRVADAELKDATLVAKFSALRVLWLDGNPLESLAGMRDLKSLRTLNLSRCQLASVAELQELPALSRLDLTSNRIEDVSALVALPALETLVLVNNPLKALPQNVPKRWRVTPDLAAPSVQEKVQSAVALQSEPSNWVDSLPTTSSARGRGGHRGVVTNLRFNVTGTLDRLEGALEIDDLPGEEEIGGGNTTLDLQVGSGRVRAYLIGWRHDSSRLTGRRRGYVYVEATPQEKGRLVGELKWSGPGYGSPRLYSFVIESMGGPAEGISYTLSGD